MPAPSVVVSAIVLAAAFLLTTLSETLWPLRERTFEPKGRRVLRNASLGGISLAAATLLQIPILRPVASWAGAHGVGLLHAVALPAWLSLVLGVVLLDLTLWYWHWANHRVPFLWRFHLAHHVDLDMDASTALRFHFGEMGLSVLYRALQVVVLGVTPEALFLWQTLLSVSILFHHSNTRLPRGLEGVLAKLVVTPRMHGIHHTQEEARTNSNWASLLSAWDLLHGTFRWGDDDQAPVGVPAYAAPSEVTFGRVLALPFRRMRDDWRAAPAP